MPIKEYGFIYTENDTEEDAIKNPPSMKSENQSGVVTSPTGIIRRQAPTFTPGDATTGWPPGQVSIPFNDITLDQSKWYSMIGYAITEKSNAFGPAVTGQKVLRAPQPTVVTVYTIETNVTTTELNVYTQITSSSTIDIKSKYTTGTWITGVFACGLVYKITNIGDPAPTELPTTSDNKVTTIPTPNVSDFDFDSKITSVIPSRVYYIRSWAQNSAGVAYGPLVKVTTV